MPTALTGLRRRTAVVVTVLALVAGGTLAVAGAPAQAATPGATPQRVIAHPGLPPARPATGYPVISDQPPIQGNRAKVPREVLSADQVDRYVVAGGNFLTVELQDGTSISRPYFTAWNLDTKQIACTGTTFDGEVLKVLPGETWDAFYVAGRFSKVTGPDGVVRTRTRIAKLRLPDCRVDTTFTSPTPNGKVDELALLGTRLFVGGDFTTIGGRAVSTVAELDARTGAVNPAFSLAFSGGLTSRLRGMAVTRGGTRLVLAGRFGTVTQGARSVAAPTAVVDVSGPSPVLTAHSTTGLTNRRGAALTVADLQDAAVSPDGTRVALAYGTATDSDYVYLVPTTEAAAVRPVWAHYMRDSSFGIGISNTAVYVTGHFCKPDGGPGASEVMAPVAGITSDCTGSSQTGGVWRSKLAALSLADGTPLAWNPGNGSFRGGQVVTVTPRGLLVGYDGNRTGLLRVGALAFFDLGVQQEDTAAPGPVTFTAPAAGASVGNPMTVSGSATDDLLVREVRLAVRASDGRWVQADGSLGGTRSETVVPAAHDGTFSARLVQPAGSYTVEAVAVDVTGAVSPTTSSVSFTQTGVDGVAPTTTLTALPRYDVGQRVLLAGTASDNEAVTAVRVRVSDAAGAWLQADGSFGATAVNLPVTSDPALPARQAGWQADLGTALPAGTYLAWVRLSDAVGNTASVPRQLVVGPTPPAAAVTAPGDVVANGVAPALAGTASDNDRVATLTVRLTDAAGASLQADGSFAATPASLPVAAEGVGTTAARWSWTAPVLPPGTYTVTATATDPAGSTTTATRAFRVQAPPGPAVTAYTGYRTSTSNGTQGYTFTVSRPTTVTALAVHDSNRNGRIDNTAATGVGLWLQGSTTALATASVPADAPATGGWAWAALATPVVLQPGTTYVAGQQVFLGRESVATDGTVTLAPGVTLTGKASVTTWTSQLGYPGTFATGVGSGLPNLRVQQ